jgi:predicted Zn-dependent protease with MMP-like domain
MTKVEGEQLLEQVMDAIDEPIAEALSDVTVYVVEGRQDPELREAIKAAGMERAIVRRDFRGLFLGTTARPLDDPAELPEIPHGSIVLNCLALTGLEDLRDTLAHEMGHALGMSEEEVENLGLG